jgi:hypothetical protein
VFTRTTFLTRLRLIPAVVRRRFIPGRGFARPSGSPTLDDSPDSVVELATRTLYRFLIA